MARIPYLFLLITTAALGQTDAAFDNIPFDQWLKGGGQARIQWSMRVFPAHLSDYQRLETSIWVDVDPDEFVKRFKPGQVEVFLEIRDHDNRAYRVHQALTLPSTQEPADRGAVRCVQHAFITPGDYQVAAAVYDNLSKEHSLKRTRLRVSKVARDPLPDVWLRLPKVDFSTDMTRISSRLSLPLKTARAIRIEVVVNESLSLSGMNGLIPPA